MDDTSSHTSESPVTGTITDEDGNTAQVDATVETTTTTTSSTAVPYSFEYGIFTLSVEQRQNDGSYVLLHRFQQKGIYHTLYGVPLGGKGHHPAHAVIEEAAQWINSGGLAEAERLVTQSPPAVASQSAPPASVNWCQPFPTASSVPAAFTSGSAVTVLDISSSPAGAEIEIDGAFVGNTPASIEVSPANHVVTIAKAGFVPWARKLKAMPGHVSVSPDLQPTGGAIPQ